MVGQVAWDVCWNERRAHFTNNLLEDDEHRILCELSGDSKVSLCGTRVVTLGVKPSQEGIACLTVDLKLSLHSPMLQRDRERISKFWLTVWISIISIWALVSGLCFFTLPSLAGRNYSHPFGLLHAKLGYNVKPQVSRGNLPTKWFPTVQESGHILLVWNMVKLLMAEILHQLMW